MNSLGDEQVLSGRAVKRGRGSLEVEDVGDVVGSRNAVQDWYGCAESRRDLGVGEETALVVVKSLADGGGEVGSRDGAGERVSWDGDAQDELDGADSLDEVLLVYRWHLYERIERDTEIGRLHEP